MLTDRIKGRAGITQVNSTKCGSLVDVLKSSFDQELVGRRGVCAVGTVQGCMYLELPGGFFVVRAALHLTKSALALLRAILLWKRYHYIHPTPDWHLQPGDPKVMTVSLSVGRPRMNLNFSQLMSQNGLH